MRKLLIRSLLATLLLSNWLAQTSLGVSFDFVTFMGQTGLPGSSDGAEYRESAGGAGFADRKGDSADDTCGEGINRYAGKEKRAGGQVRAGQPIMVTERSGKSLPRAS